MKKIFIIVFSKKTFISTFNLSTQKNKKSLICVDFIPFFYFVLIYELHLKLQQNYTDLVRLNVLKYAEGHCILIINGLLSSGAD